MPINCPSRRKKGYTTDVEPKQLASKSSKQVFQANLQDFTNLLSHNFFTQKFTLVFDLTVGGLKPRLVGGQAVVFPPIPELLGKEKEKMNKLNVLESRILPQWYRVHIPQSQKSMLGETSL